MTMTIERDITQATKMSGSRAASLSRQLNGEYFEGEPVWVYTPFPTPVANQYVVIVTDETGQLLGAL